MPYKSIVLCILGVAFFGRGAALDGESPLVWGGLSGVASAVTWLAGGGLLSWLGGQLLVYGLMFAWSVAKERKREKDRA